MSAAAGSAKPALRERCDDGLNAVLVKEVRAGLRGKTLRFAFPVTLMVAVSIATLMLVNHEPTSSQPMGGELFMAMYGCMSAALLGLVPFAAFQSMGGEWDENTFDMLVISDLRPRQIVLGKLAGAAIEGLLYLCAFAPLLVFAFLLRGLDIRDVVVLIVGIQLASLAYTAVALALSSLTRLRVVRVFLLAVLAAGTVAFFVASLEFAGVMVISGRGFARSIDLEEVLGMYAFITGVGLLGFTLACERLTHPEENHSTPLRLVVAAFLLLGILYFAFVAWTRRTSSDLDDFAMMTVVLLSIAHVFFATEAENMTRRVRRMVPAGRWRALLTVPFQPGGARGLLLWHVLVAGLLVAAVAIENLAQRGSGAGFRPWFRHAERPMILAAYFSLYLSFGTFFFAKRSSRPVQRILARVLIPTIVILSIFLPAFVGFLAENRHWMNLEHPLNPFYESWDAGHAGPTGIVVVLAVAGLALNGWRLWRGVAEVLDASAGRRRSAPVEAGAAPAVGEARS